MATAVYYNGTDFRSRFWSPSSCTCFWSKPLQSRFSSSPYLACLWNLSCATFFSSFSNYCYWIAHTLGIRWYRLLLDRLTYPVISASNNTLEEKNAFFKEKAWQTTSTLVKWVLTKYKYLLQMVQQGAKRVNSWRNIIVINRLAELT